YDILVLEYGVDHPGDMDFLLGICKPDYSIFTKLDKIHSVHFDTPNGIGDEKIKLLQNAKLKSYLNPLDNFCKKIFNDIRGNKEYFTEIENYKLEKNNNITQSTFEYKKKKFHTNLMGKENIDYIGLAFQILKELGGEAIENDFIELDIQSGRFSIFEGIKGNILIDSTYNAGPESMKKMIENTFYIRNKLFTDYKIILVLGEMRELGYDIVGPEHIKLFDYSKNADAILMIGDKMNYLYEELKKNNYKGFFKFYLKSRDAGKELKKYLEQTEEKYIVLFKGSQNTIFTEEALKEVLINKNDVKKMVRQTDDWMIKKEKFFTSINGKLY
ncbi:MAG: Mur ligase family protein, partial [Candidatus Gracilibacteria bacterium]